MGRVFQRKRARGRKDGGGERGSKMPGWYASWRDEHGNEHMKKAGETRREAKEFLAEREAEVHKRKRRPGWQSDDDGATLLGRFLETYLKNRVEGQLKDARTRKMHLVAWRAELGDHTELREIGPVAVEGFLKKLRDKGRSPATCNRYLASLRHALNTAVEWGKLPASPLSRVKPRAEENERTRVISREEEAKLLAAAAGSRNKALAPLIVIALETCARPEELLALRWPDVDLERRLVTFRKTKAKRTRQVPLTQRAIDALGQLGTRFAGEWVFVYRGEHWTNPRTAFEGACERAGLIYGARKEGGLVFRDTRRTAITRLAERGVAAAVIQRWSGHSTLGMVQRYTAVSDEAVRQVANGLDQEREQTASKGAEEGPPPH